MALRACIYKNCTNYINLRDRSESKDIKLFSFPKNPERRQKWMELGKVQPNHSPSMYYFCSDHFDKKYFAINNVRTVLVGDAVPFPYIEPEIDETYEDSGSNLDYYLYDLNKEDGDVPEKQQQLQDEQDLHVESTTMLNELQEDLHDEHFSINLDDEETDECIVFGDEEKDTQQLAPTSSRKRKLYNTLLQAQASSSNAKIIKTSLLQKPLRKSLEKLHLKSPQQSAEPKSPSTSLSQTQQCAEVFKEEIDINQLINAEQVTTFIFKGEEYVQMPKEHYVNEKMELMKKLQKMESTIRTIKNHLNLLDF